MDYMDKPTFATLSEADYAQVPHDFPHPAHYGTVPGAQPKMLAAQYEGRYYVPGCTPPEIFERWVTCEDLAKQLSTKFTKSKAGKLSHLSETEILNQYLPRLVATKWTTNEEANWIICRAAAILGWPVPNAG